MPHVIVLYLLFLALGMASAITVEMQTYVPHAFTICTTSRILTDISIFESYIHPHLSLIIKNLNLFKQLNIKLFTTQDAGEPKNDLLFTVYYRID